MDRVKDLGVDLVKDLEVDVVKDLEQGLAIFVKKYFIYAMTTQALEAIPEELVTPATPERVTSDVLKTKPATAKNPGRVAAGKRLAEHNRKAREAKKQAEAQNPPYNYNHRGKRNK